MALRDARAVSVVASLVLVWALSGAVAAGLARTSLTSVQVILFLLTPALAAGIVLLALRHPVAQTAGGILLTTAFALSVGGHAAGPRGADLALLLPPDAFVAMGLPPALALTAATVLLVAVPLWAAMRVHALGLTLDATGARARSLGLDIITLPARDADELGAPQPASRWLSAGLMRLAEGYHLPGRVAFEALRPRRATRVHVDVPLGEVIGALAVTGAAVHEEDGVVHARFGDEGEARLRLVRAPWPRVRADTWLEISGAPEAVATARRVVLHDLAFDGVYAWSVTARRWERRLNALAAEAREATSLEERGVLLEEMERLLGTLERRKLCADEWALLVAWKGQRLRHTLTAALLAPPGPKREGRTAAPGPTLAPELSQLMAAGGLDAVSRVAFAPMWVLPVWSPWGEREIAIDARAATLDPAASAALLRTMDERAPSPFVDVARRAQFHAPPAPTAALLSKLRESLPHALRIEGSAVAGPLECVYVPYVASESGPVNVAVRGDAPAAAARPP